MARQSAPWFNKVKIPKGNGKYRTIYVPNRAAKEILLPLITHLEHFALEFCPPDVVHGFWPARSCATSLWRRTTVSAPPTRTTSCIPRRAPFKET
jgi:hypothetical protein